MEDTMMMTLVEQIKNRTQLRWNRVYQFKTKINLNIDFGPYIIKTAETAKELIESFRLRHQIFVSEFQGIDSEGLDFDKFDYFFDHLIIVHKETNKIIGTYRLNCTSFSLESYTALEFDTSRILRQPGPHLELGRACIQKSFRKGSVISLLWRGIAEYMKLSNSKVLFGCSSVKVNNARDAALIYKYLLDAGHVSTESLSRPTPAFQMEDFDSWFHFFSGGLTDNQRLEADNLIPSLLKSYLKQGAKIACEPAFDEDFDCIDFLTVLKKEDLSDSLADKFKVSR